MPIGVTPTSEVLHLALPTEPPGPEDVGHGFQLRANGHGRLFRGIFLPIVLREALKFLVVKHRL